MALIKTIAEVQEVLKISSLNSESSLPDFDNAEELYFKPVLKSVYDALATAYENNTLSPLQVKLLKKVQKPLAAFAYLDDAGLSNVVFTDSGWRQLSSADMPQAFRWQFNEATNALKTKAYNAMEELFRFLVANKDALNWDDSERRKTLITNGIDFSICYTLFQPLRTFSLLRPTIIKVEDLYIKKAIGQEFLQELKSIVTPSALTEELLNNLKLAIAHFTIKHALETMPTRKSENGFTVLNGAIDKDAFDSNQGSASTDLLATEKAAADRDGQRYLKDAKIHLNKYASLTQWPTYFQSSLYTPPSTDVKQSVNAGKKTFRF